MQDERGDVVGEEVRCRMREGEVVEGMWWRMRGMWDGVRWERVKQGRSMGVVAAWRRGVLGGVAKQRGEGMSLTV